MSSVSNRVVHAVDLSGMGHDVKSKIERAAPDIFDAGIGELRINMYHSAPQDLSASPDRLLAFRKECGAAAEEHAAVRREAVVVQKVFGVENHAMARAQFAGERWRQNFGGDDERTNGNQLLLQGRSCGTGVSAGGRQTLHAPRSGRGRWPVSIPNHLAANSR